MSEKNFNPSILEEGLGALSIAACVVSSPVSRPWYSKWGATDTEVNMSLPGDELVPNPVLTTTRAITIKAPAPDVWPWLVQMGQGRGGLYSYERLENLIGCDIENADRIIPELQDLQVGDKVRINPSNEQAFDVAVIDPGKTIILRGDIPDSDNKPTIWIWIFHLNPLDEKTTRLMIRSRLVYKKSFGNTLLWRVFSDPIAFNMERKMLQGIKLRVEDTANGAS